MTDLPTVLILLQLMDSAFPVGTFAHSYGLEQAVRDRRVRDAEGVEAFVDTVLHMQVAKLDARALVRARDAVKCGLDPVMLVDQELHATKATVELRDASTATGRRLIQEVVAHPETTSPLTEAYLTAIERHVTPGTHPVALAVAGASLGLEAAALVTGLLFSTASTMHSAAMRLLPVSHRDAQAALHRHRVSIPDLVGRAVEQRDEEYASFAPLHEIASARHERSTVRFFAS